MKCLISTLAVCASCWAQTDREVVVSTLILEAGGEIEKGAMPAVLEVIRNRSKERQLSLKEICLQPKQFSCWNNINVKAGVAKAQRHPKWTSANALLLQPPLNITKGANHYCTKTIYPSWASTKVPTVTIGNHKFFKLDSARRVSVSRKTP